MMVHSAASGSVPTCDDGKTESDHLIASWKRTRLRDRYITFWRPERAGYAWSLPWAGRYTAAEAATIGDDPTSPYPECHSYAVPLDAVRPFMTMPKVGEIDGDVGPVLRNTATHWAIIRAHAQRLSPAKALGES